MHTAPLRLALVAALAVPLLSAGTTAFAADASAGQQRAQQCAICHGPKGITTMPQTPNLAGQPEDYLAAQLKAFRSGKRQNEVMAVIAKPLTDDDIAVLSAWYASIQVALVEKP